MKLQTKLPLEKQSKNLIGYNSSVLSLGSCFSENIGSKLDYFKFQSLINPLGILFHPKAIEALIENAVNEKTYTELDVFLNNEQWHSFDAHSKLSHTSKDDLLVHLNEQIKRTNAYIKKSTHIIITLGTAWVYQFIETKTIVANCHKVPQRQFKKSLLSIDAIYKSLIALIDLINKINPKAFVIFTVSPVRHLKDGFVENTLSKSHLISAIHQVITKQSSIENNQLSYFPSYEIMMDELRDYRFYNEDMIHPNQTAIDYIWREFKNVWISNNALETMNAIDSIQKDMKHKPFNPDSKSHKKFLEKLELKKAQISSRFSHIKF